MLKVNGEVALPQVLKSRVAVDGFVRRDARLRGAEPTSAGGPQKTQRKKKIKQARNFVLRGGLDFHGLSVAEVLCLGKFWSSNALRKAFRKKGLFSRALRRRIIFFQ